MLNILATQKVGTAIAGLGMEVNKVGTSIAGLEREVKGDGFCKRMLSLKSTLSHVVELETLPGISETTKHLTRDTETLPGISEARKHLTSDTDQPESSETLNITDFQDEREYLYQVYRKMKTGPVFTIHTMGKEDKYGEVTFLGNKIFVHCLSSFTEKPRNATYVWFQDLKSCWLNLEFGAFLQIPCNKEGLEAFVEIEMTKGRPCNQYLKLCTGEIGPSYKGVPYIIKDESEDGSSSLQQILTVPQYMCDGNLKAGRIDYDAASPGSMKMKAGQISVWMTDDLTFGINEVPTDGSYTNSIGKVVNLPNLADIISCSEFPMKIADCGIYFNLK